MGRSSHFTSGGGGSLALVPTGVLAGPVPCDVVGAVQEAPRQTATIATEWARIACLDMWLTFARDVVSRRGASLAIGVYERSFAGLTFALSGAPLFGASALERVVSRRPHRREP